MPTLVDTKFAALRTQGFTGAMSDMTAQWLVNFGADKSAIPDMWKEMLAEQGFSPTLVVNGDFSSPDGWTFLNGAVWNSAGYVDVNAGVIVIFAAQTLVAAEIGATYSITFTLSNVTVGGARVDYGGVTGTQRSGNGTFTELIVATSTGTLLDVLSVTAGFVGRLDNVIVKKKGAALSELNQQNDAWFDLLRSLGHTGSMNDMELQFWTAGGEFGVAVFKFITTEAGDPLITEAGNNLIV